MEEPARTRLLGHGTGIPLTLLCVSRRHRRTVFLAERGPIIAVGFSPRKMPTDDRVASRRLKFEPQASLRDAGFSHPLDRGLMCRHGAPPVIPNHGGMSVRPTSMS